MLSSQELNDLFAIRCHNQVLVSDVSLGSPFACPPKILSVIVSVKLLYPFLENNHLLLRENNRNRGVYLRKICREVYMDLTR
jgi:hypothetical protein